MRTGKIPASISALSNRVPELAARLENWANINSGSSHAAGLERMRLALRQSFAALPGSLLDEPPLPDSALRALRVRLRPDAPRRILLSGHYDTVYDAGHPFQACRWENERILRGPGVADMKGGIVVMHAALEAFEQSPGADRLGWEVLLTPDEETGSRGSAPLLAEAAQRNDFGLVFEPARPDGNLVRSRKGVGQLSVICRGRAAHVAREPNDGRNAIVALAEFLCAASRVPGKLPGALVNAGRIRGGSDATNIVPDFAEAVLDVRATRAADQTLLLVQLNELAAAINRREGLRLELAGGFNRPPKESGPAEEAMFAVWQQAARDLGLAPFSWVHAGGGSDGNFLAAAGLPNLDGVGVVGDHLHSDRESCVVASLAERAQIAALALLRLAADEAILPTRAPQQAARQSRESTRISEED